MVVTARQVTRLGEVDGTRMMDDDLSRRVSRLSHSLSGTNLVRAGDYNLRTVLQAIRVGGTTTRVALAETTGLTSPSIANITSKLTELGLIKTIGRRTGGRGQPPFEVELDADGAFSLGLNIDRDHLTLVSLDLAGEVRSRITLEMQFPMPSDVIEFVEREIKEVIASGGLIEERIVGVGVAIPDDLGGITMPNTPKDYASWCATDIISLLSEVLPWPIHRDNDAAAAALGEAHCSLNFERPNFFYLLISAGLGGGPVIDRTYHRGSKGRSGEIGLMPDVTSRSGALVQDTVSVSVLLSRLADARWKGSYSDILSSPEDLPADVIEAWLSDCARVLEQPLISVGMILDPDAILIGGRLPVPLADRLSKMLQSRLAEVPVPTHPTIAVATMAQDAAAIGAATLPLIDNLLPSDAILIQSGRS